MLYIPYTSISVQLNLVKLARNDQQACLICGEEFCISEMQNHIRTHILKSRQEVKDESILNGATVIIYFYLPIYYELTKDKQIGLDSCSWCREDGCITHIVHTAKATKITSNCQYQYMAMKYGPASKFLTNRPCTNVPLNCPMCPLNGKG